MDLETAYRIARKRAYGPCRRAPQWFDDVVQELVLAYHTNGEKISTLNALGHLRRILRSSKYTFEPYDDHIATNPTNMVARIDARCIYRATKLTRKEYFVTKRYLFGAGKPYPKESQRYRSRWRSAKEKFLKTARKLKIKVDTPAERCHIFIDGVSRPKT